tara:strand:+ start:980 stop:1357 length:378 start_codon:yes stop_codon:yes gene_type:complete
MKEIKSNYSKAIDNLFDGIKKDYASWGGNSMDDVTPQQRDIRLKMIDEFNNALHIKSGVKYDKVIQGGSVWGFIAKSDGIHKGIPHKAGDVFKAAGWRAPAKWARGNIYDPNQNWFRWTGPDYLI